MRDVLGALDVQRRRQLHPLAALQREDGIALGHRRLRPPVLIVQRQHPVHHLGVGCTARLELLGIVIAREGVDDRPAEHHASGGGVLRRVPRRQRDGRVARIARPHRDQHGLVRSAGVAHEPHAVRATAQRAGARLEPAHRVVDVGQRGGIARHRRHAEVERGHDHAALRERLVDEVVVEPVAAAPGPTVQVDDEREGPGPARLEEARQQRRVPVAEILDVLDVDGVDAGGGGHGGPPRPQACARGSRPSRGRRASLSARDPDRSARAAGSCPRRTSGSGR